MKLLVVSNMYPSAAYPVGGIFVHEQVKALRRSGVDARVVSGAPLPLRVRHPREALRRYLEEMAARRKPFEWESHDGVPIARFNFFMISPLHPFLQPYLYENGLVSMLAALAEDFPYELVHTHTAFLDGRAGAKAARHRRVPMVLTEHTGPFSMVTQSWRLRGSTVFGMRAANRIIAVSEALARDIRTQLPEIDASRMTVLPNGVDTSFFDPGKEPDQRGHPRRPPWRTTIQRAKSELMLMSFILGLRESAMQLGDTPLTGETMLRMIDAGILAGIGEGPHQDTIEAAGVAACAGSRRPDEDEETINVLWVGHLIEVKRVDRLLDAFAAVARDEPRLRLRLVGSGHLDKPLRKQAMALGMADRVYFIPHIDRAGIRAEMAFADLLAISSETETFGVVGIEAMAMGLPVVSTNCGGPADYLSEKVGLLVENSTEGLVAGLRQAIAGLESYDRAAIRRHAVEAFDFEKLAERLKAEYARLLGGPAIVGAAAG